MDALQRNVNFFKEMTPALRKVANKKISQELRDLKRKIVEASPVLTGKYSKSWTVHKVRSNQTPDMITGSGIVIQNKTDYEEPVEYGVKPGSNHPWAVSKRKGSKGLVQSKGKVWSKKAVGGVVNTVLNNAERHQMANRIAGVIIKSLHNK